MTDKNIKKSIIGTFMLLLLAIAVVMLCSLTTSLFPKKTNDNRLSMEQAVKAVERNVFELKVGNTIATGFFVEKSERGAIAVTCWHSVKDDVNAVEIKEYGKSEFISGLELLGYDADYDIAVFEIEGSRDIVDLLKTVADYPENVGSEVFLLGNSIGKGIACHDGIVSVADDIVLCSDPVYGSNIDGKNLPAVRVTAAINYGSSGCPLFSSDGRLIGMGFYQVFGTTDRPVYDMNYALPANIVRSAVNAAKLKRGILQRDKITLKSDIVGEGETAIRLTEINTPYGEFLMKGNEWFFVGDENSSFRITSVNGKKCSVSYVCSVFIDYAYGYVGRIEIISPNGETAVINKYE